MSEVLEWEISEPAVLTMLEWEKLVKWDEELSKISEAEKSESDISKELSGLEIRKSEMEKDPSFVSDVTDRIYADDRNGLISFLKGQNVNDFRISNNRLLDIALSYGVEVCAIALLDREIDLTLDLNAPLLSFKEPPLHIAAKKLMPRLVEAFLRHGAQTDLRSDPYRLLDGRGMLPLEIALESLCRMELLSVSTPELSIFKLITILCLPQMKKPLETIRLLARSTKKADYVIYQSVKEGKLIEFAVLLMVAWEKVLGFIAFQEDGSHLDGSMAIRQCIHSEILKCRHWKQVRLFKEKKKLMESALLLLEIFENAGDAVEGYLKLQPPNVPCEQVAEEVGLLLVEAGFNLNPKDTHLRDINWSLSEIFVIFI